MIEMLGMKLLFILEDEGILEGLEEYGPDLVNTLRHWG